MCLIASAALAAPGLASAEEIYSTFGPSSAFNNTSAIVVGPVGSANLAHAARFDSLLPFTVDSFDLPLNGFDGDPVTFSLHSSTGGLPGAVLHSEVVSIFSIPSTVAIHHIDFSDFDATLQASTPYWFSVSMVAPLPTQNNGQWWFNNQGYVGLATRTADGRIWNHQATLATPAFRVNGTLLAIPEPQTYALLLAGLGLLGFAARRIRGTQPGFA
ncbi:MAG TPA: PEP-CTERM sorting domain-containing protein [Burkholderiales bacterium]|nr:PEP-CTERM sorting domain-containing protein [Burkholderiales bacterium]